MNAELETPTYAQRCALCRTDVLLGSSVCAEHRPQEDRVLAGYGVYAARMRSEEEAAIAARVALAQADADARTRIAAAETLVRETAAKLEQTEANNEDLRDMLADLIERGARR